MDIETRQMHRRAVAVAAAATIVVVLGQHAALRARIGFAFQRSSAS